MSWVGPVYKFRAESRLSIAMFWKWASEDEATSTIVCFDRERDVSRPKHVKGACTALSSVPRRKASAHILKLIAHPSP